MKIQLGQLEIRTWYIPRMKQEFPLRLPAEYALRNDSVCLLVG